MANNIRSKEFNSHIRNTAKLYWNSKPNIEPETKNLEFQTAEIVIPNIETVDSTLDRFIDQASESKVISEKPNRLIWGDNLLIMQSLLAEGYEGKIDLIYVDPPFNTGEEFNFVTETNLPSGQTLEKEWTMIERLAYTDTWERGTDSYLDMLFVRFKLMRRLLSPEGSIYVHLDPNMGHRVKILLDEVFGHENFKAEISWKKTTKTTSFKNYGSEHDVIFYYVKSNESYTFNQVFRPLKKSELETKYRFLETSDGRIIVLDKQQREGTKPLPPGRRFRGIPLLRSLTGSRPNLKYEFLGYDRVWAASKEKLQELYDKGKIFQLNGGLPEKKGFLDENEGAKVNDVWDDVWDDINPSNSNEIEVNDFWDDINPINSQAIERTEYPTQKPEKLLARILEVSTREGDIVADFFGGSGTTAAIAEQLKRRWISADLSKAGIHITRNRLLSLNEKLKRTEKKTVPAKEVSPFIVQNLGNYQRHLIYLHGFNIKKACALIMKTIWSNTEGRYN